MPGMSGWRLDARHLGRDGHHQNLVAVVPDGCLTGAGAQTVPR
jgi:hypothetical protein